MKMKQYLNYQYYISLSVLFSVGIFLIKPNAVWAKPPKLTPKELLSPPPKIIRTCCSFGTELGYAGIPFIKKTAIIAYDELGTHHYMGGNREGNGNIYTRKGGFIDVGHLRDYADWTAYLYSLIVSNRNYFDDLEIHLGTEGGSKNLHLRIPKNFDTISEYQLAGKIAYDLSLWHEIATWFGSSYIPLIPERYSSFSPEDLYSNLMGVTLGIRALKSDLEFNDAMTFELAMMLDSLQSVKTYDETFVAMQNVEEVWWTGEKSLPSGKILLKRYLDNDYSLTPWLIQGMSDGCVPYTLNKPAAVLSDYYEISIKLNHKFPVEAIIPGRTNKIINQNDFKVFMAYIGQAEQLYESKNSNHVQATEKPINAHQAD